MARSHACVIALVLACAGASTAHADVYGYVDDAGTTHLATERLDDRYALFMKGDANGERIPQADAARPDDALMKTKLFQRLVSHPNIARFEPMIRDAATRRGIDPMLVKAVVAVESGFEPSAVSDKGAIGLMQVLPATAERYGLKAARGRSVEQRLADPGTNLDVGTRYLADLQRRFVARPQLALAAYNAGENAVARHRDAIPPYPETQAYVRLVDQFHAFYRPATTGRTGPRVKATIAARRNLPDPSVPLRWMPSAAASIDAAAGDDVDARTDVRVDVRNDGRDLR